MNSGAERADTANVRQSSDAYFVRLDADPPPGQSAPGSASRRARARADSKDWSRPTPRSQRRRRVSGKNVFCLLLVIGLGTWGVWAAQRPGGISGTVHSWVDSVRGDVAKVSADPDVAKARRYFTAQYKATNAYPQMSDSDLAAVGIGVGVTVDWCTSQAVVIEGATGGGTSSRLLLSGRDLGEVLGKFGCPASLANPTPWKARVA